MPLLVIIGWITQHDLTLFFADFETIVLFVSVLLVNFLIQYVSLYFALHSCDTDKPCRDGKSNYMEGLMCVYA